MKLIQIKNYLLLIDEVNGFKRGDWNYEIDNTMPIYQFDYDIKQYPGNKIIGYYPLTKEAKELDLPLLPNPFEGDVWVKGNRISVTTLYEYEERQDWPNHNEYKNLGYQTYIGEVIEKDKGLALKTDDGKMFKTQGTYWFGSILSQNCKLLEAAQSKQFSLDDMKDALNQLADKAEYGIPNFAREEIITKIIQSLSTQQLPKEFIPEYYQEEIGIVFNGRSKNKMWTDPKLKIKTNSEGRIELVGTYKY